MGPEYWSRIREVFDEARQVPASERRSLLNRLCGSDPAQRAEVESLLGAHDAAGDFIEKPVLTMVASLRQRALDDAEQAETETCAMLIGLRLGERYRLQGLLGEGGFSKVFRAVDEQLHDRPVVVKIMTAGVYNSQWLEKRLWHEIEAMARIDHPGIVGLLDAGSLPDGRAFLVMKFVEGVTLRQVLRDGPMAPDRVVRLVSQTADALAAAHSRQVLHRDLKPENIMIADPGGADERAVIIDFGIATARDPGDAETVITQIVGSRAYMAPEQLVGKPSIASDIYALGLTAYEMLTGILRQDALSEPGEDRPALGAEVEQVLDRATATEPAARFPSARELASALATACSAAHGGAAARTPSRRWLVAGGAGVLAAGVAAWRFFPRSDAAPAAVPAPVRPGLQYELLSPDPDAPGSVGIPFAPQAGTVFRAGDRLRLRLVPQRDGYLYVFNRSDAPGSPGSFSLLYPEPGAQGEMARFVAARELLIPGDVGHWIEFDARPGIERIWIIFSRDAVTLLEPVLKAALADRRGRITDSGQQLVLKEFVQMKPAQVLISEIALNHG